MGLVLLITLGIAAQCATFEVEFPTLQEEKLATKIKIGGK